MKKIISIIVFLLCVISVSAVTYASPYTGAGRSGYANTRTHAYNQVGTLGLAQTPTIVMNTTSSSLYGNTISVSIGVTSNETYARFSGPYKAPGNPGCHCEDLDENGYCDHCGAEYDEFDGCVNDPCLCATPIREDVDVWALVAALAGAYALYKVRAEKTPCGDVRDDREMVA